MKKPLRLLLVEISEDDAFLLLRRLKRGEYEIHSERVDTPENLAAALEEEQWDLLVSDWCLPGFDALDALALVQKKDPDLPFIIVSSQIGEERAAEVMKAGVHDYVPKSNLARLEVAIEREMRQARIRREKRQSKELYRAVIEQSTECIFLAEPRSKRILEANNAFRELLGYTLEELKEMTLYDFVPHDRASVDENTRFILKKGCHDIGERRYRRKDGTLVDVEVRANAFLFDGREVICCISQDITGRKRAEQRHDTQHTVSRILTDSVSFNEAGPKLLEAIGTGLGWELGALWMADQNPGVLRCEDIWHAPSVAVAAELEATSRQTSLAPGRGLPGRVWESKKPLWISDVLEEDDFHRLESAAREGLHGAFAFPIRDKSRVLGVIEFFSHRVLPPDEDLLQTVVAVGNQIGQFIERERGEKALKESEERYRVVAETASDAIFMIDQESRILFVNGAAEKIFGYEGEEMLGECLTMLMPKRFRHLHRAGLQRYLETGRRHLDWEAVQLPGLHKSGKEIPLEVSFGEYTKEGKRFFTGFIRDVTERKKAEEALCQSEERYKATFEQAAIGVAHVGLDGRWLSINRKLCDIVGYTREELMEKTFQEITHPDDLDADLEYVQRLLAGEIENYSIERRYIRKDGSIIWIDLTASLVRDNSGAPEYFISAIADITERKRMQENLQHSLDMLLALREAGQILNPTLKSEEIRTRLLEIICNISGFTTAIISTEDERGQLRIWHAAGLDRLWRRARYAPEAETARQATLNTGKYRPFRLRWPEPKEGYLAGLCLPLRVRNRTVGVLEAYGPEDLTDTEATGTLNSLAAQSASALENAQLYEELAEHEKRLEKLVDQLFAAQEEERRRVAYEVHDGLAQMVTAAHQHLQVYARRHPAGSERGRKDLGRILEMVQRTAVEARRIIANLRPTELDDFGLVAALRQDVDQMRNEGWLVDYEQGLGDERLPETFETALFRIAQEALTNVRKYAKTHRVQIELSRDEEVVRLRVRDWGKGFDPGKLNTSGPGERVGLAGMRERVASLGGKFELRSRPGEGTSISVEIPLSETAKNSHSGG